MLSKPEVRISFQFNRAREKCNRRGSISKHTSFPRKRESIPQTFGGVLSSDWIPAFAGMTGVSRGVPCQMTQPPGPAKTTLPFRMPYNGGQA